MKLKLNALQTLALGFATIILIGSVLLMLPISNKSGTFIPYLNALFTAASATCVTGLVVYDTFSQFSGFGQGVILLLIQIGGLGFMTIAVMFSLFIGKKIGLKERLNLMEAFNSMQIGGIVRLAKRILLITAAFELTGAALLAIRFIPQFGIGQGIWFSLFHAISAFCNAGFDLMGILAPYSSLTYYVNDVLVNVVILILVVVGGIGFIVWGDVFEHKLHVRRYRLHTKIVLTATFSLIVIATLFFAISEWNQGYQLLAPGSKILAATFSAITPRTAGFSTTHIQSLSQPGFTLTMVLMMIGAGSGSTAGGIKVSTFAVILLSILSYIKGRGDINCFHRRVDPETVKKAFNSMMLYSLIALTGYFLLLMSQSFLLHDVLFESLSALGTVGLSTGITENLNAFSRIIVILLMYTGRVGSMSIAMAFIEKKPPAIMRNPVEKVLIG